MGAIEIGRQGVSLRAFIVKRPLSGRHFFVAKVLIILAPSLVAARVGFFNVLSRMLPLQIFQPARHLGGDLIELLTARSGVESIFKSEAVVFFVGAEISARSRIVLVFGTSQPGPPLMAGGIYFFGTFSFKQLS